MILTDTVRLRWVYLALLVVCAAIVFHDVPDLKYDGDDVEYLQDTVATLNDGSLLFSAQRNFPGRPVVELVFIVGYGIWGDSATGFHLLLLGLHVLVCMLLFHTCVRLGVPLEIALVGGLLFLLNVAHFRAVHWIACLAYPLAMGFGLGAVLCFLRYLDNRHNVWLLEAAGLLAVGMTAHAAAGSFALFIFYLGWHRGLTLGDVFRRSWPLLLTVFAMAVFVVYAISKSIADYCC